VVTGLTNGKTYTCRVTATNAVGTSAPSAPSNTFVLATTPAAPTALSAVPGTGRATVHWTAPSNGGAGITAYLVTPYLAGTAQTVRTFNSTATTQIVTGLTNTMSYTFTVAAQNALGTGAQSVASSPILIGLPLAPTNVVAAANTGRATVSWTAPTSNGGAAISGYVVTPVKAGVAQSPHNFVSTNLSQTITGLTNNALYTFTVAAKNGSGTGLPSSGMSPITVGAPKVATAPTAVSGIAGDGAVALTWAPPASNGSASVTSYLVTPYTGGVAGAVRTYDARTTQVVTGLANGKAYRFAVRARNAAGNSPASTLSGPVTAGTPTAPASVSAVSGPGKATVSWTAPVSDNGSAITGYVLTPYVGTDAAAPIYLGVTTSRVVTGLLHSRTYTFKVAARNANGRGAQSAASNAVTPNTAPIASADTYTTNEDSQLLVAAPGILANDSDADHDPLTIEIVGYPAGGIDVGADGSFTYEPPTNQDTDESFVYRVSDGITWSTPVLVTIDIVAQNDPPQVEGEQYETQFETTLEVAAPGVLANDFDPVEFDGVTASGPTSGPAHGDVVLNSDGSFTYTPDPGYSGFDSFSYLVSDSQPGGTASAEITVGDPPVDE
jgi:titin